MSFFGVLAKRTLHAVSISALAVGILLAAGQASAQSSSPPCGIPSAQPGSLFLVYGLQFGDQFPLGDEGKCKKIVRQAVAVCHMAVRETLQCWEELLVGLSKSGKVGCSTEGDFKDECLDELREDIEGSGNGLREDAEEADDECDDEFAAEIFEACMEGFGPT
jgi:hypothetical protein